MTSISVRCLEVTLTSRPRGKVYVEVTAINVAGQHISIDRTSDFMSSTPGQKKDEVSSHELTVHVPDVDGIIDGIEMRVYSLGARPLDLVGMCTLWLRFLPETVDSQTIRISSRDEDILTFSLHRTRKPPASLYVWEEWMVNLFVFDPVARIEITEVLGNGTRRPCVSYTPSTDGYVAVRFSSNVMDVAFEVRYLDNDQGSWRTGSLSLRDATTHHSRRLCLGDMDAVTTSLKLGSCHSNAVHMHWSRVPKCTVPVMTLLKALPVGSENTRRMLLRKILLDCSQSAPFSHCKLSEMVRGETVFESSHPLTVADNPSRTLTLESFRTYNGDPRTHLKFCAELMSARASRALHRKTAAEVLHNSMLSGVVDMTLSDCQDLVTALCGDKEHIPVDEFVAHSTSYPLLCLLAPRVLTALEVLRVRCQYLHDIVRTSGLRHSDVLSLVRIEEALGRPNITLPELQAVLPKFIHSKEGLSRVLDYFSAPETNLFAFVVQWVTSLEGEKWEFEDRLRFLSRQPGAQNLTAAQFCTLVCMRALPGAETPSCLDVFESFGSRTVAEVLCNSSLVDQTIRRAFYNVVGSTVPATVDDTTTPTRSATPSGKKSVSPAPPIDISITFRDVNTVVQLSNGATIKNLKKELQKKFNISAGDQVLATTSPDGKQVVLDSLADTNVAADLVKASVGRPILLRSATDPISLKVRAGQSKKVIKLAVPAINSILQLKHDIHQSLNIPVSKLVLKLGDTVLADRHTILHLNLMDGAVLTAYDSSVKENATSGVNVSTAVIEAFGRSSTIALPPRP